jgi:hypothetical protein
MTSSAASHAHASLWGAANGWPRSHQTIRTPPPHKQYPTSTRPSGGPCKIALVNSSLTARAAMPGSTGSHGRRPRGRSSRGSSWCGEDARGTRAIRGRASCSIRSGSFIWPWIWATSNLGDKVFDVVGQAIGTNLREVLEAVMIPTLVLSYTVVGLFLAVVRLFANPVIASAVFHQGPVLLALVLFTPLLAGWAIVVGMAVSVRASEVRVAQQLGMLASFPPLGVVVLLGIGVIHPTFTAAVLFAIGLLAIDVQALRFVSRMFDRERLVTGAKATRS